MNLKRTVLRALCLLLFVCLLAGTFAVPASALRCKHDRGTRWVEKPDGSGHFEICNECGARLKTEDHDLFDDSKWNWTYYDADVIGGQPGEHAQICKKCGYTNWLHHSYSSQNWELNGKMHPNVLVCITPGCNHIKEFDEHSYDGYQRYHIYYTSYVNFDYHKTDCVYCGYTPTGHKTTQQDYATHVWHYCRNASQHWMECFGCHATYDKAGHSYETYEDDNQGFGPAVKTTVCETCGWVKSIKSTDQRNEKGTWVNFKERLKTQQDIINYNSGTVDIHYVEKPGGTKADPCRHPIKAYAESTEENRYYTYIGGKHIVRCGSCGEALSTENCTFEFETYERVRRQYIEDRPWIFEDPELGPDYVNNLYMEEYFGVGHYKICTKCGGKELVAHNWDSTNGSNATADSCVRTCKDCGFAKRFQSRLKKADPSPHFYLTYQDNYFIDANMVVHDPDDRCCSYMNTGSSHRAKCEYCGYEHTEHCDTLGWAELPGQPGKHLQFCSKCGGGKQIVDCGHDYVAAENAPIGFHAVKCPTCGDLYVPKTPCDYVLDEKNTDAFIHTYKCSYCGFEWHANHTSKTIKTNVVPATATENGHYDLLTYCEICNTEISRSTITIPKENNPTALGYVEGRYIFDTRNQAHMGSGSSFLAGTIVMDGVAEYLANHSSELLSGVTFNPSHSFYDNGQQISANSSTRIVLYANLHMVLTDYTQDEDDLDGDDDRDEYTSMTATLTFTYSAYYVTAVNGVEHRDNNAVILNQPLDLSGAPITLTLPLLTGLSSNQTMFVRQTTDSGASYTTYLGAFHADWGLATVTFTSENGFDGSFLFLPTEHWLEHIEREEPGDFTDGNIEYWHDKGTDKYYSDILCEHEITRAQTYLNPNTYTISFDAGGGSGSAPSPITGVHKQEDVTLPSCPFTNTGYEFYGWYYNGSVYKAGSLFTVTGDATLTAKWHEPGDTMCHITFHKNADDATGEMDEQTGKQGDTLRLAAIGFEREGWHFYGWSTDPDVFQIPPYKFDRETVYLDGDLDLYALWQPIYYITFDANGGEGTMEDQAYPATPLNYSGNEWYVHDQRLNANTYVRDGYRFKGWSLYADGSGHLYGDGGVSPMETTAPQNWTLYAVWEQARFTVTFDKNAGDATGSTDGVTFDAGVRILIPQCGFERDGYVFVKWSASPTESTGVRNPGDVSLYAGDTTLYAVWAKVWTVTFDKNDGSGETYSITVKDGEYDYLPYNMFVRDGWSPAASYFWNAAPDGTGEKISDHAYRKWTGDATLYAQWKKTRFTITYVPNGGEGEPFTQTVDFGATGLSSVCPRCSAYTLKVAGPALEVNFCNCCGFAVVNRNGGDTAGLAVRSYGSLADYTLPEKFDELSSLYTSLAALYPDKESTQISDAGSAEFAAYLALYDKAVELMNASLSSVTKNAGASFDASAVVGITDSFILTAGGYAYTAAEALGAIARLFGYTDSALFAQHVQATAAAYLANEAGAAADSSSNRLKYVGAVYTESGCFVLPYAFRCDLINETLLAFVIVDADGNVSVWLDDLDALFYVTLYGLTLPEGVEGALEVYGLCSLYEAPRALYNEGFTKDRYVFSKWNTAPDGSGTNYVPQSSTFSSYSLSDDLTLYAVWTPDFYTVTFNANGGEGSMDPVVFDKNVPTALPANAFTREGYAFAGWNTYVSSYASIADEGELSRSADTTLYAIWKKTYTFTFDPNGGYGFMDAQTIPEKTTGIKLNKNAFFHDTLAFDFWSYTPDGTRAFYDEASAYLSAEPESTTLYAIWKTKTDVSSLIAFEDDVVPYNGEEQNPEASIDFTGSGVSQSTGPAFRYAFFAGTTASAENLLPGAPTKIGVYTVRAFYEDYRNKGFKDALLTVTKAERSMTPAAEFLLLYGKDKLLALQIKDADGSARIEDLTVSTGDSSIVSLRAGESRKEGNLLLIALSYVGEGYTTVSFSLPEAENYKAANACITVISKNGYDVLIEDVEGGFARADKPAAPEGTTVSLSAEAKPGWTFAGYVVINDTSGQAMEVVNGEFVMPASPVVVRAEFVQNDYAISYAAVDGVTYSDDLPASAHYGEIVTLSASVSQNRAVKAFGYTCDGLTVTVAPDKNGVFSFNMPDKDITVSAITGELYPIDASSSTGGVTALSSARAVEGAAVYVLPTPAQGFSVGSITYTAGGVTKPVLVSVSSGESVYAFTMPADQVTVSVAFLPEQTVNGALGQVNGSAASEQGENEASLGITADDDTTRSLQTALDAVNVNLAVGGERAVTAEEKAAAVRALAQAGLIVVDEHNGNVTAINSGDQTSAAIRVVEKTFVDVTVKEYSANGSDHSLTLEITPKKQTVATTASAGVILDSENSVPLADAETIDVTAMTSVTVGVPSALAEAAGGAGHTVFIQHSHNGKTYEYPAIITGNASDGYSASFENPNGYSEFTLSLRSRTLASFEWNGSTRSFTSFADAIDSALACGITSITMYGTPTGNDFATVTKSTVLSFASAEGYEAQVDFNALYTDWLHTADEIRKVSTPEQLGEHAFAFIPDNETRWDLNDDGAASIYDVTALLNVLSGDVTLSVNCDLTVDGHVSINDVTALLNFLAGKN